MFLFCLMHLCLCFVLQCDRTPVLFTVPRNKHGTRSPLTISEHDRCATNQPVTTRSLLNTHTLINCAHTFGRQGGGIPFRISVDGISAKIEGK